MGIPVCVIGESGSGKSATMRKCDSEPVEPCLSADTVKNDKYHCPICGADIGKKFNKFCSGCGHPFDWSNALRWK